MHILSWGLLEVTLRAQAHVQKIIPEVYFKLYMRLDLCLPLAVQKSVNTVRAS